MRILHVDHTGYLGGAERSQIELAVAQRIDGLEPILAAGNEGPYLELADDLGIQTVNMGWPHSFTRAPRSSDPRSFPKVAHAALAASGQLERTVARLKPDIVHVHTRKSHVVAALARRAIDCPMVYHLRDPAPRRGILRRLLRLAIVRADHAVALSKWMAEDYIRSAMLPRSRAIGVVPSGIRQDELAKLDTPWLDGISPARAGFVGQLAAWKAPHVVVDVAERVSPALELSFEIVGDVLFPHSDGGYRGRFGERVRATTSSHAVTWHGAVPNPEIAMARIDILLHTSMEPEPFGRVLVEAMASGRPVIAFPLGAAPELLSDGAGYLTVDSTPEAMARRLCEVVSNRDHARQVALQARTKARRYLPLRVASKMRAEYQRMLA